MTVIVPTHLSDIEREGLATALEAVERFGPDVEAYRNLGNVRAQLSPGGGLILLNYGREAAVEHVWSPLERVCRGLIVDWRTGAIVALPWPKFFNVNEMPESQLGALLTYGPFEVTSKLDGSMGIGYYDEDGVFRIATRGSFKSEQAEWATNWWHERYGMLHTSGLFGPLIDPDVTPLFEIIYPENRVVLNYGPEMTGLHLLGIRHHNGQECSRQELDQLTHFLELPLVETHRVTDLQELFSVLPELTGIEGFVVRFPNQHNLRVKFKTEEYAYLHWLMDKISYTRYLWYAHLFGEEKMHEVVNSLYQMPELYEPSDQIRQRIVSEADEKEGYMRARYYTIMQGAPAWHTRKELSAIFHDQCDKEELSFMFSIYDGKDIRPLVLKRLWLGRNKAEDDDKGEEGLEIFK